MSDDITPAEIDAAAQEFAEAHVDTDAMLVDQDSGWKEILHYDDGADKFHVERVEDVEATLEWCKGRFNEGLANAHCEFRHVGRYPINVLELFAAKNGLPYGQIATLLAKDKKLTTRLLNDNELSGFRTLKGQY